MKTLILYATKHGAAAEIAGRIAAQIDGAVTHDLKQQPIPSIDDFDCIIVGSSIYAGTMRKEARNYLDENCAELSKKKLGLFISGMGVDGEDGVLKQSFSDELLQAVKAANVLGGIFDPVKASFFERLIMRIVTKQSGYMSNINDERISKFVEAMKA